MEIKSLEDLEISKILETATDFNFKPLAEEIMNKICIFNGKYTYHPIEIEFYIYDKNNHPDTHVYPREAEKAGKLFFHLSGMDICFKSSLNDGCFGGILIRALEREEDKQQFGGPLTCKDEVLNTAIMKCLVMLCNNMGKKASEDVYKRKGLENKGENDKFLNASYRFFREDVKFGTYIYMKDETFDFNEKIKKPRKRSHKIEN